MRIYVFSENASESTKLRNHDNIQQSPAWLQFRQFDLRGERRGKISSSKNLRTSSVSMRPTKRNLLPHQSAAQGRPPVDKQLQMLKHRLGRMLGVEERKQGRALSRRRYSTLKRALRPASQHHHPKERRHGSERALLLGEALDAPLQSPRCPLRCRHQYHQFHQSHDNARALHSPTSQAELSTDPLHLWQSRRKPRTCV
jgi:hypothetical protein